MSTTKRIPFVPAIHAQAANGHHLYLRMPGNTDSATTTVIANQELMLPQVDFLLERANDPKLVEGLEPYEASRRRYMLRKSLREQGPTAETKGGFDIEGQDVYAAFLQCIMKPQGTLMLQPIAFNYFPFEEAVCNAVTVEEPKAASANGAAAQAS
jgi:hypothetical protein